jgi:cytochrome c oxidase subunit 4
MANATEHAHAEENHGGALRYWLTLGALLFLTMLTWTLAHKDLGEWSFIIAMAIASTKAMTVVLFFMHMIDTKGASRLVFAVSIIFVLVLIAFVLSDLYTRSPLALPPGSFQ